MDLLLDCRLDSSTPQRRRRRRRRLQTGLAGPVNGSRPSSSPSSSWSSSSSTLPASLSPRVSGATTTATGGSGLACCSQRSLLLALPTLLLLSLTLNLLEPVMRVDAAAAAAAATSAQQQQQQQPPPPRPQAPQTLLPAKGQLTGGPKQQEPKSSRQIEKEIVDRILGDGYDKRIRPRGSSPPSNTSRSGGEGPTIVKVNTLVRSISKIDDVTMEYSVQLSLRQVWTDDRLAFGSMDSYKGLGVNSITLTEQERLWKPDLFFRNEKEGHFHKIILPNVLLRINKEGEVLYSIRISLVLACPMNLKYYPLDKQNCTIEMASYGYLDEDLKFLWKEENPVQIAPHLNLPRFTLETHNTAYCTSTTNTGAYSCIKINLLFKREFSYYLIQIYIPCCMLVIVSWVSFWLDPNAIPARVSLGVTTLLTMATQISGINASLPPVSYTKAIDVWTGVCLTFVFGALLEFALVNYASRSDQHKREMLNSAALTHTQQMRWREATAAAVAAGVAPPTSPPPDENSPSMLASKQAAFFPPATLAGHLHHHAHHPHHHHLHQHQVGGPTCSAACPVGSHLAAASTASTSAAGSHRISTLDVIGTYGPAAKMNNGRHQMLNNSAAAANNNGAATAAAANNNKSSPNQINCALQYMKNPREVHMMAASRPAKRKNWCRMWLAKFPTRSKRIDVISRIFFPLKFALFNLVYWTTYLFREEDTVA